MGPSGETGGGDGTFRWQRGLRRRIGNKISAVLCEQATRQEKLINQKLINVINEDQRPYLLEVALKNSNQSNNEAKPVQKTLVLKPLINSFNEFIYYTLS